MKRLIKSVLLICGLDLHRAKRPHIQSVDWRNRPKEQKINIGAKVIHTDFAMMASVYRDYPETNRAAARILSVIERFYRDFQVVDVGANCGDTIACLFDGWSGKVLAIEPDPNCQKWLNKNWGDDPRVTIRSFWLSSVSSIANANLSKAGSNTTLDVTAAGNTQIAFRTLDEVLSQEPDFTNVKFIKVDTEGFDGPILIGSRQTLLKQKPVVLFESNLDVPAMKDADPMSVFSFLMELGYDTFFLYDAYGRFVAAADSQRLDFLRDLLDYADGRFGKVYYYDAIAVHSTDANIRDYFLQTERQYRKPSQVSISS